MRHLLALTCLAFTACATAPAPPPAAPVAGPVAAKPAHPVPKCADADGRAATVVPAAALPSGWHKIDSDDCGDNGMVPVYYGNQATGGWIEVHLYSAAVISRAEDLARALASSDEKRGARVSPIDRMNGDGWHAAFSAVAADGTTIRRVLIRPLDSPPDPPSIGITVFGSWNVKDEPQMSFDFERIAESQRLLVTK